MSEQKSSSRDRLFCFEYTEIIWQIKCTTSRTVRFMAIEHSSNKTVIIIKTC